MEQQIKPWSASSLHAKCAAIKNYDDFFAVFRELSPFYSEELGKDLFELSITQTGDGADSMAGCLLIAIEPSMSYSCDELLRKISKSNWNVSNREVPFYLVSQFGKINLNKNLIEVLADSSLSDEERKYVDSVAYWTSSPAAYLAEPLHYFEWQEVIERENT
jgi:hypothetical protein